MFPGAAGAPGESVLAEAGNTALWMGMRTGRPGKLCPARIPRVSRPMQSTLPVRAGCVNFNWWFPQSSVGAPGESVSVVAANLARAKPPGANIG